MLAHTCYLRDPRVRREAEALAEHGLEVHVISLSEKQEAEMEAGHAVVNGVEIHRLPVTRKRGSALRYLYEYCVVGVLGGLKLAQLHFRGKLKVVHIHNMPDTLVFAALIPKLGGSKVVLDVHDPMPELYASRKRGLLARLLVRILRAQESVSCKFADWVISVNESMRHNLKDKGTPEEKVVIVHNFPDDKLFPVCDIPKAWPRSREGLILLYCGTVTEHYDLTLAVKAIARLAGEIPVKLRIIGDGNRLSEVLNLAAFLGVRDSIQHIGVVPIDRVRDEMKNVDIGISCHRAGVFGDLYFSTKIVEYLTQGLPVLASRTYTIKMYLPEDCLFYFEPQSDLALAQEIRFMWTNQAEVMARLIRARNRLSDLSWQVEKRKFLAFYSELLRQ
jgi:glycosyltransferase involved in cell wall biosynthesis